MDVSGQRLRTALIAWIVGMGLIALALLITLVVAAATAAVIVDQIPGGDAGLASTPALDSAYNTMNWSSLAFLGVVVVGVVGALILRRKRKSD